jgi:hypothetical protein
MMATRSKEQQAEIDKTAPVWAKCPAFKAVMCHAPWQCQQPCLGLAQEPSNER